MEIDMKRFARRSRARAIRRMVRRALAPPHARGFLSIWRFTALTVTFNAA
jgi:hypothetical protein